ncbi:diguanylate cyclase, partial [Arthrospira platensis SPKY2]
ESAATVAERCRKLILEAQIPHEASPVSPFLTISMGAANVTPSAGDKLEDFIATADCLLYRAKEGGRDRVIHEA